MELTVTQAHMEKGIKGSPSRNPIVLALREQIEAKGQLAHITLSHEGLLVVRDIDGNIELSVNLGRQATDFIDRWYDGYDIALPFTIKLFPVC